jgi:MHS family shikimate/dehydroshikimate transporter-like MFS transporter
MSSAVPASPPSQHSMRRVVTASFVGTAIEWYDFFLYGTAAALVFNKLFFPNFDPHTGTMAAFGTFAVGFFARPLGGVICGHFGDRIGRKSMLVTTLMMMGLATFAIGLLPTYEKAGIVAPILLVLLRFIQGLGVGGEWGGAVLMVVEHAEKEKRGLYASWVQAGVPAGMLLATGVMSLFNLMPQESFLAWGWRVPFLLGILLTGIGFFIRMQVLESPVFEQSKQKSTLPTMPVLEVLKTHPGNVLLAMGARLAENAFFYIFTVWVLTYVTEKHGLPKSTPLNGVLLGSAIQLVTIPWFGAISDRVGRRPVYLAGAFFLVLMAFPFFWLVDTQNMWWIWAAIILGMIGHSAMYGPQAAFFSELFGTRTRYTGTSLGYQLASPLAGGLAPLIATDLLRRSGNESWPIAMYLIMMGVITITCVLIAAETNRSSLESDSAVLRDE